MNNLKNSLPLSGGSINQAYPEFTQGVTDVLEELRAQVNQLSTEDFTQVKDNVIGMLQKRLEDRPYQTLAALVGIGFGVAHFNRTHVLHAAVRIGKLVALKAISNLNAPPIQNSLESHN
jgi:ElaB/YqjD/DUF883 family membrane-anchored ribosome-binding protein